MNDWTTILTFVYPHEAHIAKGILESENIPVQIRDELTAQVNNFYSNAIGGVKLLVRKNDYKKAYEILVKSGYITEEKKSKNRFWIWFDKTSSKLPFIGNSILELRLMIVATLIIILITIPVVLLMLPSTIEKLTENNWCVDKIYYNGKEINYNSGEIALESEKLTLTINGIGNCNETMNFSENGIVDFEQESKFMEEIEVIVNENLEFFEKPMKIENSIFIGNYDLKIKDNTIKMQSDSVTIIGKAYKLNINF